MSEEIARLERRLQRERIARKEAESILEEKSVELFHSNLELKELTKHLELRVEERTKELEQSRDEALKLAEVKSEFLANMSHELRTPLNGVLGMLTLLKNTSLSDKQAKLVNTAVNSGELLLTLINDVLDLSKLEENKLILENIAFDPIELVQLTCEPFSAQAVTKGIELICIISPELPIALIGDPTRIKQIIINLVSNALKFTEQGEVLISAHYEDDEFVITVSDTGIGMSQEHLDKVLNKFSQANESTTRKYGGTGLGLPICSMLVDAMEGMFLISSELNQGTSFEVRLPLKKQQGDAELIYATELEDKNVLVAFKNPHIVHYMETVLKHWHIQQVTCVSDTSSLKDMVCSKGQFDLIICDASLSDQFNTEVLELVRQHQEQCNLISYWQVGTNIYNEVDHTMMILPIKQSELYDAMVQTPNCGLRQNINEQMLPTQRRYKNTKVLLAEDNQVNQEVAQELLSLFGCKVDIANNGQEALHRLIEQEYDLVLMDIQMPVMDGITATQQIRQLPQKNANSLPIIALTAHSLESDKEKSIQAGMNAHLTKPIELGQLANILSEFLTPSNTATSETLAHVPDKAPQNSSIDPNVLDIKGALDRMLGNDTLYRKILKTYIESTQENLDIINQLDPTAQTHENEYRAAHTIKGSSANIGATAVSDDAQELEFFIKNNDLSSEKKQPELESLVESLNQSATTLFSTIEQYTQHNSSSISAPIDNVSLDTDIASICSKIIDSIYSDLREVEVLISELENKLNGAYEPLMKKIAMHYSQYEMLKLEDSCKQLIEETKNA
jgi:signal transduction histidine kinase/CheY-like chemotaxis protein